MKEKVCELMYIDEVERIYYVKEKELEVGTKELEEAKLAFEKVNLEALKNGYEIKNFDKTFDEIEMRCRENSVNEDDRSRGI